ncbi:Calmodulin-binding transcription activator 1 [Triplophysa tibetana]|uniref:Calmodulin-binding transcription activator 1 n=1 Tax=Triplophysa tibetana TaxID=1572043 RepID=A0A5A9NF37_9TELE|nr:Calmodulin-binding transcription activator 1 [Triplophysa tibetana]
MLSSLQKLAIYNRDGNGRQGTRLWNAFYSSAHRRSRALPQPFNDGYEITEHRGRCRDNACGCTRVVRLRHYWMLSNVIKGLIERDSISEAAEWVYDTLQQEEGEIQERWLLLEKEKRRQNHAGGSHEAESAGSGGERPLAISCKITFLYRRDSHRHTVESPSVCDVNETCCYGASMTVLNWIGSRFETSDSAGVSVIVALSPLNDSLLTPLLLAFCSNEFGSHSRQVYRTPNPRDLQFDVSNKDGDKEAKLCICECFISVLTISSYHNFKLNVVSSTTDPKSVSQPAVEGPDLNPSRSVHRLFICARETTWLLHYSQCKSKRGNLWSVCVYSLDLYAPEFGYDAKQNPRPKHNGRLDVCSVTPPRAPVQHLFGS